MPIFASSGSGSRKGFGSLTVALPGFVTGLTSSKNLSTVSSINLSWSAPASGPTPTSYIVTSNPATTSQTVVGTSATFNGLTTGQSYTFTVQTKRNNTNGKISSPTSGLVPSAYSCAVGSLSGSNCTYNATYNSGYSCPGADCTGIGLGCGWTGINVSGQTSSGTTCCWNFSYCYGGPGNWGGLWMNQCCSGSAYSYYSCNSGGSLSGSTCTLSATIS
jgi:hypothetical protein